MKSKPFEMAIIFDIYGEILTDKQRELFDLYYNEDLSLSEIAEHINISRQGVRDGIVRAEEILRDIESKLGLAKKYTKMQSDLNIIVTNAEKIIKMNDNSFRSQELEDLAEEILKSAQAMTD